MTHDQPKTEPAASLDSASHHAGAEPTGDLRAPRTGPSLSEIGVRALAAVGTGVGVLGFVTLVGGAIFYAQMSAVGLPSDEIVSAMPQSTLLVVGARLLVPVLLFVALWLAFARLVESLAPAGWSVPRIRTGMAALLALAAVIIAWVDIGRAHGSPLTRWVVAVLGFVLVAIVRLVTARSRDFRVFAVAIALTAAIFVAVGGIELASIAPTVRAVALARVHGPPIAGIYAASNSSDVLVGEICQAHHDALRGSKPSGVVIVVPWRAITRMLVTTNGSIGDALRRQNALLKAVGATVPARSRHESSSPPSRPTSCTGVLAKDLDGIEHVGVPGVLQGP